MRTVLIYTIQPGDSLALISISLRASAGISPADIERLNPTLLSEELACETRIKIPYFKASGHFYYEIMKGDTLHSICDALANAAGVTVMDLIEHNAYADLSKLQPGQSLLIPFSPKIRYMTKHHCVETPPG
ncbi:LysM peptidoglycan-binding domain-containing protein [Pseudoalteromonas sp. OOF1S-7]|uniref:LysM peptidoglycan-binding domain-containing protein n=1 Tax=Pseudoalteromonas sp. OOF1S-7 TaxID=2917757 RepID=UPI001EF61A4D|nr:LysM peptidoglycan-binding domain-containing protein [Pseudoalteromonas sp. OOF1S-7]MCG7534154.1 LysM peptidoglycan-binding domain-containing protein [Pseudoalteromonas sp. OOF1S-7]